MALLLVRLRTVVWLAAVSLGVLVVLQTPCEGQEMEDVVYLKDGSVIRGTIVEQVPGQSILIETRDGNRFRYTMDMIERIGREAVRGSRSSKRKNPTTAGVLSGLLVGAGQAYNGEWGKAALFFGGAVLFGSAAISEANSDACLVNDECGEAAGYALVWVGIAVWSVVDAVSSAKRINRLGADVGPVAVRLLPVRARPSTRADIFASQASLHLPVGDMARVPLLSIQF